MGFITYADPRFSAGMLVNATEVDAAFTAVSSAATGLTADNFRATAGLKNENKASPYSVCVLTVTIPSFTYTHESGDTSVTLFAYPHNNSTTGGTNNYPPSIKSEQLVKPFYLVASQCFFDSGSGTVNGDSITLVTKYIPAGVKDTEYGFTNATAAGGELLTNPENAVHEADHSYTEAVAVVCQLRYVPFAATSGTRTITNWTGTLVLEVKHVD